LLGAAQNVDRPIDKDMTADLGVDRDLAKNISPRIELENPMLIPLA
jgi:hypothetical protein